MKSKEVAVWASPVFSLWQISSALKKLRVSHSIASKNKKDIVVDLRYPQPSWVHLSSIPSGIQLESVNFIVSSYAELSRYNYPTLAYQKGVENAVREALTNRSRVVPVTPPKMTALEYVNEISEPSLLNEIQGHVNKIQPYSLRKETQVLVLNYLNSVVSKRSMEETLRKSYKTEGLIVHLKNAELLRQSVARLKKESLEDVATSSGVPTFELLYLSKVRKPTT